MNAVNPPTYILISTKGGKVTHVTSSASQAREMLRVGLRLEIWSRGQKIATLYDRTKEQIDQYKPRPTGISQEEIEATIRVLNSHRGCLTAQQYKTLKGQALAGDIDCALKGLQKIKRRIVRA